VPVDRKYTQAFFLLYNQELQYLKEQTFERIIHTFAQIYKETKPEKYVGNS